MLSSRSSGSSRSSVALGPRTAQKYTDIEKILMGESATYDLAVCSQMRKGCSFSSIHLSVFVAGSRIENHLDEVLGDPLKEAVTSKRYVRRGSRNGPMRCPVLVSR